MHTVAIRLNLLQKHDPWYNSNRPFPTLPGEHILNSVFFFGRGAFAIAPLQCWWVESRNDMLFRWNPSPNIEEADATIAFECDSRNRIRNISAHEILENASIQHPCYVHMNAEQWAGRAVKTRMLHPSPGFTTRMLAAISKHLSKQLKIEISGWLATRMLPGCW